MNEGLINQQPIFPCLVEYLALNDYFEEGPEVVDWVLNRARSGDIWAQYNAGKLYYDGCLVPHNHNEAVKWWELAAEQGHPTAQWRLGEFYASRQTRNSGESDLDQDSTDHDKEQAKVWLGKAAQQGVVAAMGVRGGLEYDPGGALKWFRMGAEHGDVDCMYALGEIYAEGSGGAHNGEEAVKWFCLAAEQGHNGAPYILGRLLEEGADVAQDLAEAARYYRMGAKKDHNGCQYLLGKMLVEGRGIPVDYAEAEHWLNRVGFSEHGVWELLEKIGVIERDRKEYEDRTLADCAERMAQLMPAAEKGDAAAQFELGEIYRQHHISKQAIEWHWQAASQGREDSKAVLLEIFIDCWYNNSCFDEVKKWVRELAHSGNARAQYLMAHCEDRYDEDGNYSQIYKFWMSKSAEQGYPEAQYELALSYGSYNEGTFNLYLKAALSGNIPAHNRVAECYFKGMGTDVNLDAALEWAKRAVKVAKDKDGYDHVVAQTLLGNIFEAHKTAQSDLAAIACYVDVARRYAPEANSALGRMYEAGRGVEQDHAKAVRHYMEALSYELGLERNREKCFLQLFRSIKWYADRKLDICKQNAERGCSSAQVEYGIRIYDWGGWKPENDAEATSWFRLSADQGNPVGQYCLGRMICSTSRSWGHPVAMQMFRNAARKGLAEAQTAIAQYYRERADYAVAVRWYGMAAEQGEYAALVALGEMYANGEGVTQNFLKAAKWCRQALAWDEKAWAKRTGALLGRTY